MKPWIVLVSSWLALGVAAAGADREWHVSPEGDDDHPGNSEQPFATFERAQRAVRATRAEHPDQAVTVTFQPGRYELETTLYFTAADSGASAEQPVVYRAAPGGEV